MHMTIRHNFVSIPLLTLCLSLFCCWGVIQAQHCDSNSCDPQPSEKAECGDCSATEEDGPDYTLTFSTGCRKTTLKYGGWVEAGVLANAHGSTGLFGNGPMHAPEHGRTDFNMHQLFLYVEKELDCKDKLDWGGRVDLMYGVTSILAQSHTDQSFDYGWGGNTVQGLFDGNDGDYAASIYQAYGQLGCGDLSVKYGKFVTPIGWEATTARDNFFYSHSLAYWIEPSNHVGAVADYALTEKLTLSGGWTASHENGFLNRYGDSAFLGGLTYALTDKLTCYYYINAGRRNNGVYLGESRFDQTVSHQKYSIQSFCFEWKPTDKFTYVFQYNLRNDAAIDAGTQMNYSTYSINNHFLYSLTDQWGIGLRAGWLRDNGGYGYVLPGPGTTDYYELTLGLNWNPTKHWSFRPEIRYDWSKGAEIPFAAVEGNGTERNQLMGGIGMVYIF